MKKKMLTGRRLPLLCLAAVLAALALPPAVFALWDGLLLAAPHSQTPAQSLSDAGCDDPTACLLYDCAHLLNVPLGADIAWGGTWSGAEVTPDGKWMLWAALHQMQKIGMLTDDQVRAILPNGDTGWSAAAAPGGLLCLTAETPEPPFGEPLAEEAVYLNFAFTPQGKPIAINYHWPETAMNLEEEDFLKAYCTLLELDGFTDWQTVDWGEDAGCAMYSESSQLYLSVSSTYSVSCSAVSMTPQTFASLLE